MKHLLKAAAFAALTCSFLPAQTTGTTHTAPTVAEIVTARVARLTKILTLTAAQESTATTLFTTEVTALQTLDTSLTTARTAITTAVEANSATGIATAATQIGTLTAQQEQVEATADAAFYVSLTADQQTKYKALLSRGLDDFGPGPGPGGPH